MSAEIFYRRPLPKNCIEFSSSQGKQFLINALLNGFGNIFFILLSQFVTQSEPAFCGVSSLIMVLNALGVDSGTVWKAPWRWFSESMLDGVIPLDEAIKNGITLEQFNRAARSHRLISKVTHGEESEDFLQALRAALIRSTRSDNKVIMASYDREVLGQTGSGHFSPLAAYDPDTDRVLILDVARFKYSPHWVQLELLSKAMCTIDESTGKSRGFVELEFEIEALQLHEMSVPGSFYRCPLPESCISFSSAQGKQLLFNSLSKGFANIFFTLASQFLTQSDTTSCGVSSLVMVLNALGVDPGIVWKSPWRWFSETMLDLEQTDKTGITLDDINNLASRNRLTSKVTHGEDSEDFLETLRAAVIKSVKSDNKVIVAYYDREVLGQTGSGHFSPIAAYDPDTDQVLILDVARFQNPPHWVQLEQLSKAMMTTEKKYGFVELEFTKQTMPLIKCSNFAYSVDSSDSWEELLHDKPLAEKKDALKMCSEKESCSTQTESEDLVTQDQKLCKECVVERAELANGCKNHTEQITTQTSTTSNHPINSGSIESITRPECCWRTEETQTNV